MALTEGAVGCSVPGSPEACTLTILSHPIMGEQAPTVAGITRPAHTANGQSWTVPLRTQELGLQL